MWGWGLVAISFCAILVLGGTDLRDAWHEANSPDGRATVEPGLPGLDVVDTHDSAHPQAQYMQPQAAQAR
jgi:hypothetical protein